MARCSICYTVIAQDEAVTSCSECTQEYHQTCWTEIGGCGTYGCKRAAQAQKPPLPVLVGAGWGDTKPCPACGLQIASSLLVCSCGAAFPWADPMTTADYGAWKDKEKRLKSARSALIWMFIGSLLAVTAPLVGPIAGVYAHRKRKELAGAGGTYLAMGYGSAALGVIYAILIAAVALGA
jgi:hypothetical protein